MSCGVRFIPLHRIVTLGSVSQELIADPSESNKYFGKVLGFIFVALVRITESRCTAAEL